MSTEHAEHSTESTKTWIQSANPLKDFNLYDAFITIITFKVVSPFIGSIPLFNTTKFWRYVGTFVTLVFVPLFFNIRTPSIKILLDSNYNLFLKLFVTFLTMKTIIDDPAPTLSLTKI